MLLRVSSTKTSRDWKRSKNNDKSSLKKSYKADKHRFRNWMKRKSNWERKYLKSSKRKPSKSSNFSMSNSKEWDNCIRKEISYVSKNKSWKSSTIRKNCSISTGTKVNWPRKKESGKLSKINCSSKFQSWKRIIRTPYWLIRSYWNKRQNKASFTRIRCSRSCKSSSNSRSNQAKNCARPSTRSATIRTSCNKNSKPSNKWSARFKSTQSQIRKDSRNSSSSKVTWQECWSRRTRLFCKRKKAWRNSSHTTSTTTLMKSTWSTSRKNSFKRSVSWSNRLLSWTKNITTSRMTLCMWRMRVMSWEKPLPMRRQTYSSKRKKIKLSNKNSTWKSTKTSSSLITLRPHSWSQNAISPFSWPTWRICLYNSATTAPQVTIQPTAHHLMRLAWTNSHPQHHSWPPSLQTHPRNKSKSAITWSSKSSIPTSCEKLMITSVAPSWSSWIVKLCLWLVRSMS